LALVFGGAEVIIIAGGGVQRVDAPLNRAALVRSADVVIVALQSNGTLANSFATGIVERTGVAVITGLSIRFVKASEVLVATVISAEIAIVASKRKSWFAKTTHT
jgi:hypothetical protein